MLVLSRKKQDSIVIDNKIHVTIVSCEKGKVKLGIEAPEDVRIMRSELLDREEPPANLFSFHPADAFEPLVADAVPSAS